jgi:Golgi phosphoprotein 3
MQIIAEEILLLALDADEAGGRALPVHGLNTALAGAVLMDLALLHRVDTDLESLAVVDEEPTGDPVLDDVLRQLAETSGAGTTAGWVDHLARDSDVLQARLLDRLVERGAIERSGGRMWRSLGRRRFKVIDGRAARDIKRRIAALLLSDAIPDPKDVALIALADACAILDRLFEPRQAKALQPRIAQLATMDLIGQAMARTLRDLQTAARGAEARWFS